MKCLTPSFIFNLKLYENCCPHFAIDCMTPPTDPNFEALLEFVKRSRGFDFTGYKRSTLIRRVAKRLQALGIEEYQDYHDYLEVHPDEFELLFNTLLINVTSFFRDQPTWSYMISDVIPGIVSQLEPHELVRVWSAGCASGEEAYTLAIALAEVMGIDQFRNRVKIYATDVDEEALNHARQGCYTDAEVEGLSPEQLDVYFDRQDNRYVFRKDLRRSIIFGRNDLIQDAPISRIDLLVCRNTLMYFNAETQAKILPRFHFALKEGGVLLLGKAEMLLSYIETFAPIDLKRRIFARIRKVNSRDQIMLMAQSDGVNDHQSLYIRLREAEFNTSPVARIVVDLTGIVVLINNLARALFGLASRDVGRPLQDLEVSYRPVELRTPITQAYRDRRAVLIREVEWRGIGNELIFLEIQVDPLADLSGNLIGVALAFVDSTRYVKLQEELEHSHQELEMSYEELQSTNEELETTNEELQSSNEELETTNEELQSTNEELETMNEELQSTNEELQTVNDELQRRSGELNHLNAFLAAILTSLKGAVVVLNQDLQVQIWNEKAEELWGLRSDEAIGQNFLNLDIGLPVDQLRPAIRSCLSAFEPSEVVLDAINRRGRSIRCRVTSTPLLQENNQAQGVILLMEEVNEVRSE